MLLYSAGTGSWHALGSIRVQAEDVVRHRGLMPEVHDNCVVLGIWTSSDDEEHLVRASHSVGGVIRSFRRWGGSDGCDSSCWVAVSAPDHVAAVLRVDVVAAWSSEDSVPPGAGVDQVTAFISPDGVLASGSEDRVLADSSMEVVMAGATVNMVLSFSSVNRVISALDAVLFVELIRAVPYVLGNRCINRRGNESSTSNEC